MVLRAVVSPALTRKDSFPDNKLLLLELNDDFPIGDLLSCNKKLLSPNNKLLLELTVVLRTVVVMMADCVTNKEFFSNKK